MTRKEAIEFGNMWLQINEDCKDSSTYEFFQMAIKALEQEPCEDAINRQEVLDLIADYDLSMGQVVKGIHALPSVTPQEPKTGHWIKVKDDLHNIYSCSECGSKILSPDICKCKFCFNCEAKMIEPQESEE